MSIALQWAERLDPTRIALLQAILGGAVLGSAYGFQYLGGLQPCALCLYQRWPWWIAIGFGLVAVLLRDNPGIQKAVVALASLAILAGAGVAGFHVGVEQQLWPGLASCGGVSGMPMTVEALKQQIMNAPVVRCDEVAWSLMGISMAGYNMLLSLALGLGGLVLLWQRGTDGDAA
ncbi:MAG: disulfide bond formation protein B [Alphaproteobacteria bacterium]